MKNLLNFFVTSTLVAFIINAASAQVRFGAKAGLNLAGIAYSDDYRIDAGSISEGVLSTGIIPAFHVGGLVEFDLWNNVGLSAGLQLSMKGGSRKISGNLLGEDYTSTSTARPVYVQLPVIFYYRNNSFFVGAGPYAGIGVAGKVSTKTKGAGTGEKRSRDIKFDNEQGINLHDNGASLAPVDYGAGIELGYEFGSIRVSASCNLGLANVLPENAANEGKSTGRDYKNTHNVIGVSVAYLLGGE